MQADESISQQDLLGRWMHAHEEDPQETSGREVYRPHDWSFGPSRGRRGFDLLPDGRATVVGIAAADGTDTREGRWSIEPPNVLVIESGGDVRRWRVEQASPDRLVVLELLGR